MFIDSYNLQNGPYWPIPVPPSNTPALPSNCPTPARFSVVHRTPITIIEAEPVSLQPERTTEPLQFLNHRSLSTGRIGKKSSMLNHNNVNSHTRHRSKNSSTVDRPTLTTSDTPPASTTNTYASLSVVIEKNSNGPMSMRRLLTVMRYQSGRRRPATKTRKITPVKSVHSR
jgi:hypothetical protein